MSNREYKKLVWKGCYFIFFLSASPCYAQDNQLWLDFQLDKPWANKYLFECTGSFQSLLNSDKTWHNYALWSSFEYQNIRKIDLIAALPIDITKQKDGINSVSVAPSLGARYHFSQGKKVDVRFIFKWEERFFNQVEGGTWEFSNRIRLKGELWYCINGPNLFTDKLWYTILDYEEFFVLDKQVDERYAIRRRARLGAGYRLDYSHRFELIYTLQSSRDEIDDGFVREDNVIQLRYKMFLNAATANPK